MKMTKVFDKQNKKWIEVKDYRGDDAWLKMDGLKVSIDYLGELKAEHTIIKPPEPFYHDFIDGKWVENKDKKKRYDISQIDHMYLPILNDLKDAWLGASLNDIPDNEKPIEFQYQLKLKEYTEELNRINSGKDATKISPVIDFCKLCGTEMLKNENTIKCPKCGWEEK